MKTVESLEDAVKEGIAYTDKLKSKEYLFIPKERDVIRVITPFYEAFFEERLSNEIVAKFIKFVGKRKIKKILEEYAASGGYAPGLYDDRDRTVYIDDEIRHSYDQFSMEYNEAEKFLLHELSHRTHDLNTNICRKTSLIEKIIKYERRVLFFKSFFDKMKIKYNQLRLVQESVAYTTTYLFERFWWESLTRNVNTPITFSEDKVKASLENNFWNKRENVAAKYELQNKEVHYALYDAAENIGFYLAKKYRNDPNLGMKLKQLRTLDDLKKLVGEE